MPDLAARAIHGSGSRSGASYAWKSNTAAEVFRYLFAKAPAASKERRGSRAAP